MLSEFLKIMVNPTTGFSYLNDSQDIDEALFGIEDNEDGFISLNDLNHYLDGTLVSQAQQNRTAMNYNSRQAEITRRFNSAEALKAREWQEEMSNTAYQRAVQDLKKAGLNPVLALMNSGATSYSGSSASAQSSSISNSGGDTVGSVLGSILKVLGSLLGG